MTGNLDLWVEPVLERLGVRSFTSRARMRDGCLEGVEEILHKGDAVTSCAASSSASSLSAKG